MNKFRPLFLLILFSIITEFCFSQTGKIAYVMSYYDVKKKAAILLFNDKESLFIYNKIGLDSVQNSVSFKSEMNEDKTPSFIAIEVRPLDEKGTRIYRNFPKKIIVFREPKLPPIEPYIVYDNWVEIPWKIKNDYRVISGWKCQKVVGYFRGREYTVWFTKEIPYSYGPWKLFGLPGTILAAKDATGEVDMRVKSICYPCKDTIQIKQPSASEQKTLLEYVDFNDHIFKNVVRILKSKLEAYKKKSEKETGKSPDIQVNLGNPRSQDDIKIYRKKRLEIIYEWEEKDKNSLKKASDTQIKKKEIPLKN